jgi:hypothetical protein
MTAVSIGAVEIDVDQPQLSLRQQGYFVRTFVSRNTRYASGLTMLVSDQGGYPVAAF